jgi:hypothetical protein
LREQGKYLPSESKLYKVGDPGETTGMPLSANATAIDSIGYECHLRRKIIPELQKRVKCTMRSLRMTCARSVISLNVVAWMSRTSRSRSKLVGTRINFRFRVFGIV